MDKVRKKQQGTRNKNNNRAWLNVLKNQAKEFCLTTGLHGYKYIVQQQRSKTERIIWAIIVFTSLCCAVTLMRESWKYNLAHSTITVVESIHHGTWNYPFPAVTICNVNVVSYSLAKNFVGMLQIPNNTSQEFLINEMRLLIELLDPGIFGYDVTDNLTRLQDIFDLNNFTISEVLSLVAKNCSSLITMCKWQGMSEKCDLLFKKSLSRDGFCCSFNYLTLDNTDKLTEVTPRTISSCGYQTGLTMVLTPEPADYLVTLYAFYGVKIMLHDPYNYPDYNADSKLVALELEMFINITPEKTYSTDNVKKLTVPVRNCVFKNEREVRIDENLKNRNLTTIEYSYVNCLAECRATTIRAKCDCIPYYFPQNGARVCNLRDIDCLKKHIFWYDTSWPGTNMTNDELLSDVSNNDSRPCECMPDCTLHRYALESSQSVLNRNNSYNKFTSLQDVAMKNHSILHIFFGDLVSIQYRCDAYYNWFTLFASFGGIIGLFAGFSLISGFELMFFFTIRLITNRYTRKKKRIGW